MGGCRLNRAPEALRSNERYCKGHLLLIDRIEEQDRFCLASLVQSEAGGHRPPAPTSEVGPDPTLVISTVFKYKADKPCIMLVEVAELTLRD